TLHVCLAPTSLLFLFLFTPPPPTHLYTLSLQRRSSDLPLGGEADGALHRRAALPRHARHRRALRRARPDPARAHAGPDRAARARSEEHTSELQSRGHLVCRLLLEKKNTTLINPLVATRL